MGSGLGRGVVPLGRGWRRAGSILLGFEAMSPLRWGDDIIDEG